MYIEAGKAVLCEKPLCMNVRETEELVSLARERKVFLMEAIWSRCLPAYKALMQAIAAGEIGDVKQVFAFFGFPITADRLHKKELGGGTVLDLGVYTIQFAQLIFGGEMPVVTAAGHLGPGDCDMSASMTLTYPSGGTASLATHSEVQLPNEVKIIIRRTLSKLQMSGHSCWHERIPETHQLLDLSRFDSR